MPTTTSRTSKCCIDCNNTEGKIYCTKVGAFDNRGLYLIIALITSLLAVVLGLTQEVVDTSLDTRFAFDYWSVAHFSACFGLFFFGVLLFKKHEYAFVFAIIASLLFEVFERYMEQIDFIPAFSTEIWGNVVMDIIMNVSGAALAWILTATIIENHNHPRQ